MVYDVCLPLIFLHAAEDRAYDKIEHNSGVQLLILSTTALRRTDILSTYQKTDV